MSDFKSGLIAGLVSGTICNPLDVIRINTQLNLPIRYNLCFLYRGLGSTYATVPSFWALYFHFYKNLNYHNTSYTFINGYLSANIASTVCAPLFVIRQKNQTMNHFDIRQYYKRYGLSGFYKGLFITYFVNTSFVFYMPIYEFLKSKCIQKNTYAEYDEYFGIKIFTISAIAKTIATLITYPLDTIRAFERKKNISKHNIISQLNKTPSVYFRGMSVYLFRSLPYYTSTFYTFEMLQK